MIYVRDLCYAIVMESGFAASRAESYRDEFNDMNASDGLNYAREAYLINGVLNRAKDDVQRFGILNNESLVI